MWTGETITVKNAFTVHMRKSVLFSNRLQKNVNLSFNGNLIFFKWHDLLVNEAVMQHEYRVIGCSGYQRHSAIEVSVDQVVHRSIQVPGIIGNLKTWEDRGTHFN